ncbi:hypothetical protein CEY12_20670 [Chryseobacterium sp. T16E-39]|nr:hypothetical protein CEY12_20670 [Chryseobacterium sp. T16E-39]
MNGGGVFLSIDVLPGFCQRDWFNDLPLFSELFFYEKIFFFRKVILKNHLNPLAVGAFFLMHEEYFYWQHRVLLAA